MPIERLVATGSNGRSYVVVRKTPVFPHAVSRPQPAIATYLLETGEDLSPTSKSGTFRIVGTTIEVTVHK